MTFHFHQKSIFVLCTYSSPSCPWSNLLPAHHLNFAGCHLCTFFLSTYNMSVAAPACTTSCSLALFKTCSSLLAASFQ